QPDRASGGFAVSMGGRGPRSLRSRLNMTCQSPVSTHSTLLTFHVSLSPFSLLTSHINKKAGRLFDDRQVINETLSLRGVVSMRRRRPTRRLTPTSPGRSSVAAPPSP